MCIIICTYLIYIFEEITQRYKSNKNKRCKKTQFSGIVFISLVISLVYLFKQPKRHLYCTKTKEINDKLAPINKYFTKQ